MVQGWDIVSVVSGAEDGPRVGCCEHSEGCRVWLKDGMLLVW